LEQSSVCVMDATGRIIREGKVASEPVALADWLLRLGLPLTLVGLEAGPMSQWLHAGLVSAGLPAVLLETRHVIPAAEKNDSSWGFPNRRKYDSLHIEAVRGEFASDGQGDRDHLF
jgi:hypothetical protein